MAPKATAPKKLDHVRPHGALVGVKKIINPATVLAGLEQLGLMGIYKERTGKEPVKPPAALTVAVRVIDERVNSYVEEKGAGFECIVHEEGVRRLDGLLPG